MLLVILTFVTYIYFQRKRNRFYLEQAASELQSVADTFCLGSASRCNSVRLPNATLCSLMTNALAAPKTPALCSQGSTIPHIIHQSWKQPILPDQFFMW